MSLSDAVQIVHVSPDILQVYFPPRSAGIVYLVFCAVFAVVGISYERSRYATKYSFIWSGAMCLFFLFAGLDMCSYHAPVTLSAKTHTLSYEERTFYYRTAKTFPLSSMEEAIVEAGSSQNRKLVLLVSGQPRIPLGDGYNSRGNQFEAAHAINAFAAQNAR